MGVFLVRPVTVHKCDGRLTQVFNSSCPWHIPYCHQLFNSGNPWLIRSSRSQWDIVYHKPGHLQHIPGHSLQRSTSMRPRPVYNCSFVPQSFWKHHISSLCYHHWSLPSSPLPFHQCLVASHKHSDVMGVWPGGVAWWRRYWLTLGWRSSVTSFKIVFTDNSIGWCSACLSILYLFLLHHGYRTRVPPMGMLQGLWSLWEQILASNEGQPG